MEAFLTNISWVVACGGTVVWVLIVIAAFIEIKWPSLDDKMLNARGLSRSYMWKRFFFPAVVSWIYLFSIGAL